MTNDEKRKNLINCRRTYAERGAKLIEVTHLDGRKSGIANPKAVKAVMDALKVELDRQIEELNAPAPKASGCPTSEARSLAKEGRKRLRGDPERSGLNEVVRDWMLREHPGEREMLGDFSETVSFKELAKRMESGEDFYAILDCTESQQREYCFTRLYELTGKDYDYWHDLWLHGPEAVK